jgi:lysozyme
MNARDLIKNQEGLRLEPYRDTLGHLTVGYGHLIDERCEKVPASLTEQQAEALFIDDFRRTSYRCELLIPGWDDLDEVRQAVLLSMAFNLGIRGLLKFQRFLEEMHLQHWERAADEMLRSLWAGQVGNRATELADMMRSGMWRDEVNRQAQEEL